MLKEKEKKNSMFSFTLKDLWIRPSLMLVFVNIQVKQVTIFCVTQFYKAVIFFYFSSGTPHQATCKFLHFSPFWL